MVERLPHALRDILASLPALTIAFSGGVDSRFLCHAAKLCGCKVLAIHAYGPHTPASASLCAQKWAEQNDISFRAVAFDPLELAEVSHNTRNRCYACKQALIGAIAKVAQDQKRAHWPVCDGSNADDEKAFRPGLAALKQAGVISPLALAGMTKAAIRSSGEDTGLSEPGQKSRPCLLTRFAYNLPPEKHVLKRLEDCEMGLQKLFNAAGYADGDFRLRLTPGPVLQVSLPGMARAPGLAELLARQGFAAASITITPQISGFFDKGSQLHAAG